MISLALTPKTKLERKMESEGTKRQMCRQRDTQGNKKRQRKLNLTRDGAEYGIARLRTNCCNEFVFLKLMRESFDHVPRGTYYATTRRPLQFGSPFACSQWVNLFCILEDAVTGPNT